VSVRARANYLSSIVCWQKPLKDTMTFFAGKLKILEPRFLKVQALLDLSGMAL
jgi:hypothetical protein